MKPERLGDLYALVCALVCGVGNIVLKIGLADISPELFNFYYFSAAFILSLFSLFKTSWRREIVKTELKVIGLIGLISLLFTFGIYTLICSIKLINPATVSFLSRLEVIIVIIMAFFFLKERLDRIEIVGGILAVSGVLVLKLQSTLEVSQAATLMIISSFFFAAAEISVKRFVKLIGTMRFVFFRNLFASVIFYFMLKISGEGLTYPGHKTLGLAFLAAFLLPILGRATFIEALKRIDVSRAALINQSIPLFTAFFALIILNTVPPPIEWLGGGMIIVGVIIIKLMTKKPSGVST